jgi:hypothetical protein
LQSLEGSKEELMPTGFISPAVVFRFEMQDLVHEEPGQRANTAQALSEVADFATRAFPKSEAVVELKKASPRVSSKGDIQLISEILITLAATARAAKPLIESIAQVIGRLNERLPNNTFEVTFPDGVTIGSTGRITSDEFTRLGESVMRHLRDTDLSSLAKATYRVSPKRRK